MGQQLIIGVEPQHQPISYPSEDLRHVIVIRILSCIIQFGIESFGSVSKTVGKPGEKIGRIFEPKYTYEYLSRPEIP